MIKTQQLSESTYQFNFTRNISESEFLIDSPQKAVNSPLGKKLFGFPWTERLKIAENSLELTKKDWVDWDILLEPLQGLLEEHLQNNLPLEKAPTPAAVNTASDEAQSIKDFIKESINPSLAMHDGWVELKSFENKTAYLSMGGGCQGCASSQATMINGIETALKEQFPFVDRVMDITDHSAGDNPYY